MTMAGRSSAIPLQRPRLRPVDASVPRGRMGRPAVRDHVRERWLNWAGDVLACKYLIATSLAFTAVALCADYRCGAYVTATSGVKAPDLVLDRFRAVDMSFLFVYGYAALIAVMFLQPILFRVRTFHVVAIQFSLLLLLRSVFMIFTHLETPAGSVAVTFPGLFNSLYFENDMFFSGHTAMPFLGFYLFRRSPLRYVFLVGAIVMGVVVLAMHLHYSIDVFAAFFMTYCSYRMGNRLLRRIDRVFRG